MFRSLDLIYIYIFQLFRVTFLLPYIDHIYSVLLALHGRHLFPRNMLRNISWAPFVESYCSVALSPRYMDWHLKVTFVVVFVVVYLYRALTYLYPFRDKTGWRPSASNIPISGVYIGHSNHLVCSPAVKWTTMKLCLQMTSLGHQHSHRWFIKGHEGWQYIT